MTEYSEQTTVKEAVNRVEEEGCARLIDGREVGGLEIRMTDNPDARIFSTLTAEVKR